MAWISNEAMEASLKAARPAEAAVAAYYIRGCEFSVKVDAHKPVGVHHPDNGDIHIKREGEDRWKIIEVKASGYPIHRIEKWGCIMIGRVHTIDGRDWKADLVYVVSSCLKWAMVAVMEWVPPEAVTIRQREDKYSDDEYDCYVVPTKHFRKVYIGERQ